jgi:UDP:flavonoid glycosyltransferase YjiC (YdhE family)
LTVVITTGGTLGDHLPMVGLGRALAERGHRVRLAFNPEMHGLAERAGLEVLPVGPLLGPAQARDSAADWDHWGGPTGSWEAEAGRDLAHVRELEAACAGAKVLVAGAIGRNLAAMVSERTGIPWVLAAIPPFLFTGPRPGVVRKPEVVEREARQIQQTTAYMELLRTRYGLPEQDLDLIEFLRPPHTLIASSRFFSEPRGPFAEGAVQTGFWFVEESFTPEGELRRFVEDGPPPLVLAFSSLPLTDPSAVLDPHVRAAAILGHRLVVQRGWAQFDAPDLDPSMVRVVDYVPHDWLLPRAAALIAHGGIGTVARAIRAGCPILVEPYGNDQFFNAWRVMDLGIGWGIRPPDLNTDRLVAVLRERVLNIETRDRMRTLSGQIAEEGGLDMAVIHLEAWIQDF